MMKRLGEMDLTLVAFYGSKPEPVAQLVDTLQTELRCHLGDAFCAYDMAQVHGTIVGLEGRRVGAGVLNTNLQAVSSEPRAMDLGGLFRFFLNTPGLPLRIRVGGFVRSKAYPFTSRGLHPYSRSFSLQGPIAVAVGWPVAGDGYPNILDALRRQCAAFNVLHKYHDNLSDIDNDFFFVLGRVNRGSVSEEKAESLQDALRQFLSARRPVDIAVGPDDLSVLAYLDGQLPNETSVGYSLTEALARVEELKHLYRQK